MAVAISYQKKHAGLVLFDQVVNEEDFLEFLTEWSDSIAQPVETVVHLREVWAPTGATYFIELDLYHYFLNETNLRIDLKSSSGKLIKMPFTDLWPFTDRLITTAALTTVRRAKGKSKKCRRTTPLFLFFNVSNEMHSLLYHLKISSKILRNALP